VAHTRPVETFIGDPNRRDSLTETFSFNFEQFTDFARQLPRLADSVPLVGCGRVDNFPQYVVGFGFTRQ
jgi:hypothetical protein